MSTWTNLTFKQRTVLLIKGIQKWTQLCKNTFSDIIWLSLFFCSHTWASSKYLALPLRIIHKISQTHFRRQNAAQSRCLLSKRSFVMTFFLLPSHVWHVFWSKIFVGTFFLSGQVTPNWVCRVRGGSTWTMLKDILDTFKSTKERISSYWLLF